MPFLEGATTAGNGRRRYVDCNKCLHLKKGRNLREGKMCICPMLTPRPIRRTVDYCRYFDPDLERWT